MLQQFILLFINQLLEIFKPFYFKKTTKTTKKILTKNIKKQTHLHTIKNRTKNQKDNFTCVLFGIFQIIEWFFLQFPDKTCDLWFGKKT